MSRDHSVMCETCGESYGGMNADTEEHACSDMVNVEESPGVYVHRKRQWGECFCHAYDDSECACGGLWEQRETLRQRDEVRQRLSTLAANLAATAGLCAAFAQGEYFERDHWNGRWPERSWRPGCGHPAPGIRRGEGVEMSYRSTEVKMFVAAHEADYALVIWASPEVMQDIKDRGTAYVGDVFYSDKQNPPCTGLWVWEGWQHWNVIEMESDVHYVGTWRKPTGAEMLAAARGLYPFKEAP